MKPSGLLLPKAKAWAGASVATLGVEMVVFRRPVWEAQKTELH